MITRDASTFFQHARGLALDFGPATARAAFLVAPDGFALAEQSAADNLYMAGADGFDADAASRQHRALHRAVSEVLPAVC
ncbi:MAG: amidinotransferase, partial [Pseudomonadota bacterium]|nr:amidinotransferase [Pseudomonadota bacterium]